MASTEDKRLYRRYYTLQRAKRRRVGGKLPMSYSQWKEYITPKRPARRSIIGRIKKLYSRRKKKEVKPLVTTRTKATGKGLKQAGLSPEQIERLRGKK